MEVRTPPAVASGNRVLLVEMSGEILPQSLPSSLFPQFSPVSQSVAQAESRWRSGRRNIERQQC
jgi:hypothetical protein